MRLPLPLIALALAACGSGQPDRPRLLVVGWDGGSFREVDPLLEAGRLPNLARLMDRGVQARLESTVIPISSAAWCAATTGKGPGETGVFGFFETLPGTYDVRLVSARSNQAAPLWRILTARGRSSIVFGVPLTYPPEPIRGTLVAGMLSPFSADYTWPPELAGELRERGFEPDLEPWIDVRAQASWDDLDDHLRIKREVLLELLAEQDWDLAFLVFKSLDVFSHLSMSVEFSEHVAPVYQRLDKILGALVEAVGPDTDVLVVSDHGFFTYPYGLNLHAWLVQRGFSVRKERVKRFEVDYTQPFERSERQAILQLRNELDWSRTRAFAEKCEGNFGSIRLNLRGREPEGIVDAADVEATLGELEEELRALVDEQGNRLVVEVWRGRDLYPGSHTDAVPDLLFETLEHCQVFTDPQEERLFGDYVELVPDHDRMGIFVAAGPSIAHEESRRTASIVDIAPTALHLLDQPVYREMQGRVLSEILRLERPIRLIAEADDHLLSAAPAAGREPFGEDEIRELEERLRRLGYVD